MNPKASQARLIKVPLDRLRPHPDNANVMDEPLLAKLAENIRREGDYPPLVIRLHPTEPDAYQILDGHQRAEVLRCLGHESAHCYL
jgi:ParB family chromosome partitioning protein